MSAKTKVELLQDEAAALLASGKVKGARVRFDDKGNAIGVEVKPLPPAEQQWRPAAGR